MSTTPRTNANARRAGDIDSTYHVVGAHLCGQIEGELTQVTEKLAKYGDLEMQLENYKDQWRRHYEQREAELKVEQQEWFSRHLNEEADGLRAELAVAQAKIKQWKLRMMALVGDDTPDGAGNCILSVKSEVDRIRSEAACSADLITTLRREKDELAQELAAVRTCFADASQDNAKASSEIERLKDGLLEIASMGASSNPGDCKKCPSMSVKLLAGEATSFAVNLIASHIKAGEEAVARERAKWQERERVAVLMSGDPTPDEPKPLGHLTEQNAFSPMRNLLNTEP